MARRTIYATKIDYYNENNQDAEYQKPIYNIGGGDPYYRVLGYKKGSFLKVRNISLGYTFPQKLINKWGMSNLKLYVQAKNPGRIFSNIDFLELDASQAYTSTWNRRVYCWFKCWILIIKDYYYEFI